MGEDLAWGDDLFRDTGPVAIPSRTYVALLHVTYSTIRYRTVFASWFLYPVLQCALAIASSLVKNLERQYRNGWCLTRRLAISVTSQWPWCTFLASDIGFKWRLDLHPLLGIEYEEKKSKVSSSISGEVALLVDGFLLDIKSCTYANQSKSFTKKSDVQTLPFMVTSERHDRHIDRKTTRNAPSAGTERIDHLEKCHSGLFN